MPKDMAPRQVMIEFDRVTIVFGPRPPGNALQPTSPTR